MYYIENKSIQNNDVATVVFDCGPIHFWMIFHLSFVDKMRFTTQFENLKSNTTHLK